MKKLSITLPDDLAELAAASGNASGFIAEAVRSAVERGEGRIVEIDGALAPGGAAYVDAVLRQRQYDYSLSRAELRDRGWTVSELRVASACTMGTMAIPGRPCGWLASDMSHPRWVEEAGKAGISPERWAELARRVASDEPEARAVYVVAAEYWAERADVVAELDGDAGS